MSALGRLAPRALPAAVGAAALAEIWVVRAPGRTTALALLALSVVGISALWALADLERFVLVPFLAAMTFPATLVAPAGAQVAFADVLLLVALGAWLVRASVGAAPAPFLHGNRLLVPGVVWVGVTTASIAWSVAPGETVKMIVQATELVVVVPLVFASIPRSLARIREGLVAYVVLTSALAIVTVAAFLPRALHGDTSGQYLPGLHKNAIGGFLGVGLVLAFTLSLDRTASLGSRRRLRLLAALELAGLVASLSRGAAVGVLIALLLVATLLRRGRLVALAVTVAASAIFLVLAPPSLDTSPQALQQGTSTTVRILAVRSAVDKIRERPLLGTGAGTYWDDIPELGIGLQDPNNLFLLTWGELGVAGMGALLFLLWRYLRLVVRGRRLADPARAIAVGCGAAGLSLLVHFQFDVSWSRGSTTICFALIGLSLAALRLAPAVAAPRPAGPAQAVARAPVAPAPPPARMRVVQVVTSDAFAGIERHVFRLARGLRESGVDCTIACPPGAERLRAAACAAGIPVIPDPRSRRHGWLRELTSRLAESRPDVVHVHDGAAAFWGWRAASGAGSRFVRTQHFVEPASAGRAGWHRAASLAVHRTINSGLDTLVAVSESAAEAARERGDAGRAPLEIISPGIDVPSEDAVEAARAARAALPHPVVAYVGRLENEKGLPVLLCAAELVRRELRDCRFVIAGAGGVEGELREFASGLGLDGAIEWTGEVSDPQEVYARAHVLAHPAAGEGFGLAVAEAMASGLPVVGVDSGGIAELVVDGVTGHLVPAEDPGALAKAILQLLRDPAGAVELGRAARERAVEHYGSARTVERTLRLYERITGAR